MKAESCVLYEITKHYYITSTHKKVDKNIRKYFTEYDSRVKLVKPLSYCVCTTVLPGFGTKKAVFSSVKRHI